MSRILSLIVLIFIIVLLLSPGLSAQCPMCKLSVESNLRDGGTQAKGLNTGILYMLSMPYLIVGTLGYLWYKNRKNYDENRE